MPAWLRKAALQSPVDLPFLFPLVPESTHGLAMFQYTPATAALEISCRLETLL